MRRQYLAMRTIVRDVRGGADYSEERGGRFSLDSDVIDAIFRHAKPLAQHESRADLNFYYGPGAAIRPRHVVKPRGRWTQHYSVAGLNLPMSTGELPRLPRA